MIQLSMLVVVNSLSLKKKESTSTGSFSVVSKFCRGFQKIV